MASCVTKLTYRLSEKRDLVIGVFLTLVVMIYKFRHTYKMSKDTRTIATPNKHDVVGEFAHE